MLLYELCECFTSSSVTVSCDCEILWFGKTYDLPLEYRYFSVRYADTTPREKFRNNQTDLYVIVQTL